MAMTRAKRSWRRTAVRVLLGAILPAAAGGCVDKMQSFFKTDWSRFFAPEQVVRRPDRTAIAPIYESVGPVDQSRELPPNATFPREGDWEYSDEDYVIGPTDILGIGVLDLFQPGQESVLQREVSDSGFVDLPLIPDRIEARGMTKDQLKVAVERAYEDASVLKSPMVSITILARRQNTFSILGAVSRPNTYSMLKKDMRLLEALAVAGGITQTNIKYLYVIRPALATRRSAASRPAGPVEPTLPPVPPELTTAPATEPSTSIWPKEPATVPGGTGGDNLDLGKLLPGSGPATEPNAPPLPASLPALPGLTETSGEPVTSSSTADTQPEVRKEVKWIYADGRWIPVSPETVAPHTPGTPVVRQTQPEQTADPFGWSKIDRSDMARVIAISIQKLQSGDPRQNIVIRENDIVQVPALEMGEFYVMGEVGRPGAYSLAGRRVTIKQAVAAASNLSPQAWPENAVLIRRIGDTQEQVIPVNLEAICRGEDPDYFLKPDDVLAVGSNWKVPFFLVMRNAFRMTYGFGFIYDRNFADPLFVGPNSKRFTHW